MPHVGQGVDAIAKLRVLSLHLQSQYGKINVCAEVTEAAFHTIFPWGSCTREFGAYTGTEVPALIQHETKKLRKRRYAHWWLRFADGTIVDPTANQFGDRNPIRIIPIDDPRQCHYQLFPKLADRTQSTYIPWGPQHPTFAWLSDPPR